MRVLIITCILSILGIITTNAQHHKCYSDEHTENLMKDPQYAADFRKIVKAYQEKAAKTTSESRAACANRVTIPIAIHFQNTNTNDRACLENLANEQIARLNADFQATNEDYSKWTNTAASFFPNVSSRDMCVEFCVATRNHPSGYGLSDGQQAITINRMSNTDRNTDWAGYVNIFVMDLGDNLLGYAPVGGRGNGDGVVIGKHAFGGTGSCGDISTAATLDRGRTLTHELGHYFFLFHIWGNAESCNNDDGVSDTPACNSPNFFCPDLGKSSCGSNDLHMNYMDYSNDECMYMFTSQQADRMENWISSALGGVVNNAANVCGANVVSCSDGIQNGDETGIDCGGSCTACATCSDDIQNGDETGIDCGGSCAACPVEPTCNDGIKNGNETGVDCGGSCPNCPDEPTCTDNIQNGDETGIDCGGSCAPCPSCNDNVQNGDETGVDCGGSCPDCPTPEPTDCEQNAISILLKTDLYGSETTWEVKGEDGNTIIAGGPYSDFNESTVTINLCVPNGCYTFNIYDAFGDGICCRWGNGGYTITDDATGAVLGEGSQFSYLGSSTFSAGGPDCGDIEVPSFCGPPSDVFVGYYANFRRVLLSWIPVPDANRYQIQYRQSGDNSWNSTRTGRTNKVLSQLRTGTLYEYRIRARCPEGWTDYSDIHLFETLSGRIPAGVELLEYNEITLNHLFPNPALNELKIDYTLEKEGKVALTVYDMLGRQVLVEEHEQEDGTQKVILDISELQSGTHILQIKTEEEMVVKKFIKK